MATTVFYIFYTLCAVSAVSLLFVRNLFKAALLLLVCLLSVAGIYVFMYAEFLAVTQILIYAGGLVVVIIFGIMLTSRLSGAPLKIENTNTFAAALAGALLFALLIFAFRENFLPANANTATGQPVRTTGIELMTSFVLPFEIAGILLLVALVGAAIVATAKTPRA